ncbi:CCA tRNA nucleotidyltransferase [Limosilactobacillus sp. STM2_1]|uniref:CCA-adding enzyme n=1 Tax=Limosilactobacillus rudii TaxID=2759755 RepID=A0A7W3UK43_9LACO|nr:CCA tRNA nucleotidyltransferase [Limosilactobacillus rudii]MBB1079093.1 CCA tRNA nucleotidyltransferase [Limosilactobacillus rudii]MBB1097032.1 CCA tRNA nucleotidyltransferase [Limosilactobacillus rudii]MCD7134000.1 CCA tRNA nucleotidyltransferase [Limosilactobacillus rudii]
MKIKQLPAIFEPARPVLQKIEAAGYEAYFVGGCVRDTILHDDIHDIDIATSAYPSEIKEIFNRTVDTGIEHGTVMILDHGNGYETTTFRTESGYQDYRRPDKVTFVRSLSEDLKRRDFTINALALREDGEVIDLFNGLADLQKHLIRAVGDPNERFHEDALRMMRAVRFASKLNFVIDGPTLTGIKENAPLLAKIAVERIRVEFEKLMLGQNPVAGLKDFISTGLYKYCPGLANARDILSTLLLLNHWKLENEAQLWAALCIQLQLGQKEIGKFLKKWKTANDLITRVKKVVPAVREIQQKSLMPVTMFKTGQEALQDANQVAKLYGWAIPNQELQAAYQQLPIKESKELAVDGKMLITKAGIKPGPLMGKIIQQLTTAVINGKLANDTGTLLNEARKIMEEG